MCTYFLWINCYNSLLCKRFNKASDRAKWGKYPKKCTLIAYGVNVFSTKYSFLTSPSGDAGPPFYISDLLCFATGSASSKYEHRRASALFCNIQNIRICMGKKPFVSVTYENERISINNSLPHLKCVLRLSAGPRADLWPFYGFVCKRFSLYIKVYQPW